MSPEAEQNQADTAKAPHPERVAAANAKVDESIASQAEQANAVAEAKRIAAASDQTEDAEATAAIPVDPPVEADPPHPAIAELEGPASDLGHVIDITGADLDALPIGPVAVDDHGRIWRIRRRNVEVVVERVGDEAPVPHIERRDELVLVGRVQR